MDESFILQAGANVFHAMEKVKKEGNIASNFVVIDNDGIAYEVRVEKI